LLILMQLFFIIKHYMVTRSEENMHVRKERFKLRSI